MNTLKHIAIIPDGNRRWAKTLSLPMHKGHRKGAENIFNIAKDCRDKEISFLTVYVLSSENIQQRNKLELQHLYNYIEYHCSKENLNKLYKEDINLNIIGDFSLLPLKLEKILQNIKKKDQKKMTLTLAIGYGGQQEIIDTVNRLIISKKKKLDIEIFKQNLWTKNLPDIDLLIRTGGEERISNFLLWQISYAEIYFEKKFWPEFTKFDLYKIIDYYYNKKRKYGQ